VQLGVRQSCKSFFHAGQRQASLTYGLQSVATELRETPTPIRFTGGVILEGERGRFGLLRPSETVAPGDGGHLSGKTARRSASPS